MQQLASSHTEDMSMHVHNLGVCQINQVLMPWWCRMQGPGAHALPLQLCYASVGGARRHTYGSRRRVCVCLCVCMSFACISLQRLKTKR